MALAGALRVAADGAEPSSSGVDGDVDQRRLAARPAGGLEERAGAIRQRGRRQRPRLQHALDDVVVRLEHLARELLRPARRAEDRGRRAEARVQVVQRAAADPDALDHVDPAERAVLQQPLGPAFLPEPPGGDLADRPRELLLAPPPPSLEDRDREAALREPGSRDRAAEPRADHDHVVRGPHGHLRARRAPTPDRLFTLDITPLLARDSLSVIADDDAL
jgi:hypothetical protein